MKIELTSEEVSVIRRALRFALDMGEDTYFAFFPDADDYSDGDQDKDEAARSVAQSLIDRLPSYSERRMVRTAPKQYSGPRPLFRGETRMK
jgi:hypothetical protein